MKLKLVMFVVITFSLGACGGSTDTASSSSASVEGLSLPTQLEVIPD